MGATSDVARMLTLVPWLLQRPGASVAEAAAAFGVDPDAIRRDLDHLDFCGLPGLGGGALFDVTVVGDRIVVQMADELRRPLRPTPSEALRLVLLLDAVSELLADEVPTLRSAVAKVREALGVPEDAAQVLEPAASATVAAAKRAVADRRRVRLHYQGRADTSPQRRELDPWALHVVDGDWYLQGHDHTTEAHRTFKLERVANLEMLGEPVVVDPPPSLPAPRYVPRAGDVEVVVETTATGSWLAGALALDGLEERDDGGARLRFRTDAPAWITRLVVAAGGQARVIDPRDITKSVRDIAQRALARYVSISD